MDIKDILANTHSIAKEYDSVIAGLEKQIKDLNEQKRVRLEQIRSEINHVFYTCKLDTGRGQTYCIGQFTSKEKIEEFMSDIKEELESEFHIRELGCVPTIEIVESKRIDLEREFDKNPSGSIRVKIRAVGYNRH